jgi:hypothetical protein
MEELESLEFSIVDKIIKQSNVFGFYSKAQVLDLGSICKFFHDQNISLRKDMQALLGRVKNSDDLRKELVVANAVIRELVPHAPSLTECEIQDFIADKKASFSFFRRKMMD